MNTNRPLGPGGRILLAVLAIGAMYCGVDAILSDSVTTPAKFGGDNRVQGTDTILVGVGWILMGLAIMAKIIFQSRSGHSGSVIAVALAIIGGLFWFAVVV